MESMLRIAEDADGDLEKADVAERRIIAEVRKMGNELLTGWAQTRIEKVEGATREKGKLVCAGKKTPLAQYVRRNRSHRAGLQAAGKTAETV